ncbi:MAG: hypothetical protein EOO04_25575 [Chitinophagaceae bacterium]|nr:MAG: hypothetical protein EOO04_25575 [Chitinophagaceae bacterium]
MCTVTFIPSEHSVILTSNRDEKQIRATAEYPAVFEFDSGKILFPKDADAGGTWIAVHENGNAIVLLNGGIIKHIPKPPYRKSRGLIVLDILDSQKPFQAFRTMSLDNIEPFTLIICDQGILYECRWDGENRHILKPDPREPHIWSSVTLYSPDVIAKREGWFRKWLKENNSPTQEDILLFHQFTGDGDAHNDLLMNRDGETFTVSITSLKLDRSVTRVTYLDLKNNHKLHAEIALQKNTVSLK